VAGPGHLCENAGGRHRGAASVPIMNRLRLVAPVVLLAALAAACGGSTKPATAVNPPPSSEPPVNTATAPADVAGAKAEITRNWETFLRSGTPRATAVKLLEKGSTLTVALAKATQEDKATGGARSAKVSSIVFTSPTNASVAYKLHAAGTVLNSSGVAVLEDGVWKVSDVTFCTLVLLGNNEKPVKGC
jgi:hypothetical protein